MNLPGVDAKRIDHTLHAHRARAFDEHNRRRCAFELGPQCVDKLVDAGKAKSARTEALNDKVCVRSDGEGARDTAIAYRLSRASMQLVRIVAEFGHVA